MSPAKGGETKLPVVYVEGPAVGSACLAAQLEGQFVGPVCEVELTRGRSDSGILNYLFIDGLPTATEENSDGSVLRVCRTVPLRRLAVTTVTRGEALLS